MNKIKKQIQDLRSAEIAAQTRGDIDLLIQLKEERLLLELEIVRFAKKSDSKVIIFKPQKQNLISIFINYLYYLLLE